MFYEIFRLYNLCLFIVEFQVLVMIGIKQLDRVCPFLYLLVMHMCTAIINPLFFGGVHVLFSEYACLNIL